MSTAIMTTATSMALLLSVGFLNHGPSGESAPAWFSHRPAPTVRLFEVPRFRWTSLSAECRDDHVAGQAPPICAFVETPCGIGAAPHPLASIVWSSRAFTVVCAELVVERAR